MCRELTVREETCPCQTLQSCAVQLDGSASRIVETASEGHALKIRATLNEIGVHRIDDHLADIRKYGAFAFEFHRDGRPVADAQQFQPSKVRQPKQGVNEFLH
jgi:hypothetical protein